MEMTAPDEAPAATYGTSQPAAGQAPGNRKRLDPIEHAWRACNPRAPLPRELRLASTAVSA